VAVVDGFDVDSDPSAYTRTLDDAQLVALAANVNARVQAVLAQGVPLPMSQIETHHLLGLLEALVGPEDSLRVREWHLVWLDTQLDNVEAQMRARLLDSGIFDGAAP